jgi:hypothetical protein
MLLKPPSSWLLFTGLLLAAATTAGWAGGGSASRSSEAVETDAHHVAPVAVVGRGAPSPQWLIACNGSDMVVDLADYDTLVVGAGLSGAVLAQQHAEIFRQRVLVLERRSHIAGNACVGPI